ncbi:hypothetical protein E4191_10745 [Paracoccus liaowanqingii]|uniref:JmjC domain-containing protein n=1 Tax=Paracoccus liaowanqingii TaxID=2560053 RepID=A0A4P7HLM0_9RHOB|nr:cupin-like domain-containing protein [Paracoccus liaowanqingii]QBX35129.1 hypothetical protein E4191_10745 [Paracoccus liaowanqingii]
MSEDGHGAPMYKLYHDVLGAEASSEVLAFALSRVSAFEASRTVGRDPRFADWRRSVVLFADKLRPVAPLIEGAVRSRLPEALAALGVAPFGDQRLELQLTAHGDGQYYHWHTDNGSPATHTRTVTFVYYFHAAPRRFSGGELVIHAPTDQRIIIEPRNDSLVFFASGTRHEVLPVRCPGGGFGDSRFTLNGWIHRRPERRPATYFDAKVLGKLAPVGASRLRSQALGPPQDASSGPLRSAPGAASAAETAMALGLLDLYGALWRRSDPVRRIDTVDALSGSDFFQNYYLRHRPVLIRGGLGSARSVRAWTPDALAERFGSERIEITARRDSDPEYEINFRATTTTITLRELVDRLRAEPKSNDFYLVARNDFFRNPAFLPLRREIGAPADIVDAESRLPGSVKLWIGPAGTVTPLHFDLHSILFAQMHGRKRFWLIPPFDAPKLYLHRRFYSAVNPEAPDLARFPRFAEAWVAEVDVFPEDLLFLPAGWFHGVRSLDVSISATFSNFRVPGGNHRLPLDRAGGSV